MDSSNNSKYELSTGAEAKDISVSPSSAATSAANSKEPPKRLSFVFPEYEPTQEAVDGIRFDFCHGARIVSSKDSPVRHIILLDRDSDNVLFEGDLTPGAGVVCSKKYRINYRLHIGDPETHKIVYTHDFSMKDKPVLVQMPYDGALGDTIAWFSVCDRFQRQEECELHVLMPQHLRALFEAQYPNIQFEDFESAKKLRPYAIYYLGLYFRGDEDWQPFDFRLMSLIEPMSRILGVKDYREIPPRVHISEERVIQEPYVVIATQASSHAKHWCNPAGWRILIRWLKLKGYRVLCIDKDREVGDGDVWHCIPHGCEDFTGNRPLQERIDLIAHADFFVGLSSGLSWLAWTTGTPIVLIAGICMPFGEFQTPYRVQTLHTCHGCWNDTRYDFDHHDFMWCPKHKGTKRAYECTKAITPRMVIDVIRTIPGTLCEADTFDESGYSDALA